MKNMIKKISKYIQKNNAAVITLVIILFIALLAVSVIAFKQYISILLIAGVLIWSCTSVKEPYSMPPVERNRIWNICKNFDDVFCDEFDKYANKLHIAKDFPFFADEPIIQSDRTILQFSAKANIGKADIHIEKLKETNALMRLVLTKKIVGFISRRAMNVDVQRLVNVTLNYTQSAEYGNVCEIIVTINNQLFPYYITR